MKKITCLFFTTALTVYCLKAQQQQEFNGGGFESWTQIDPNNEKPLYWDLENCFIKTLNNLYALPPYLGVAPLTAFRETQDKISGNYSLKLVADRMSIGDAGIFLPGAAGTLDIGIIPPSINLNKPFTSSPTALTGYLKYLPVNGDSAAVEVILRDEEEEIVGKGKLLLKNATDGWEEFRIVIDYFYDATPSTIAVTFAASAHYDFESLETMMGCDGQAGSTLLLDDVAFLYQAGIKEMLDPEIGLSVFPNPSAEQITVRAGKEINGTVCVYDYLSRKVGEYPLNGTETSINIADYASGSYLINVVENDKVITTNRFVKQ